MPAIGSWIVNLAIGINVWLGLVFLLGKIQYPRLFSFLFFAMAYVPFQFQLVYTQTLLYYPYFFLTYIPFILWFGPIAYIVFRRYIFEPIACKRTVFWHLILPVFSTFMIIPFVLLMPPDDKLDLINHLYYDKVPVIHYIIFIACSSSILFYIYLIIRLLPNISHIKSKNSLFFALFIVTVSSIVVAGLGFITMLTHSLYLLYLGNVLISVVVLVLYGLHIRFDTYLPQLIYEIREFKKRRSHLNGVNVSRALFNLDAVMTKEEIYTQPDLTLEKLAERINLNKHQLSELLNNEIGKSFNTYIVDYRVNRAIDYLKNDRSKTILYIALSVGFNSNSAFYSAFKKVTGKSPRDFR